MRWKTGISILVFMIMGGCAHISMDGNYAGPGKLPEAVAGEFAHGAFSGDFSERLMETTAEYRVKEITLSPSAGTSHTATSCNETPHNGASRAGNSPNGLPHGCDTIVATYYQLNEKSPAPVIIFLPALAGRNIFVGFFARYFASRGFAAVTVHRQKRWKSFDAIDTALKRAVFEQRTVMDWACRRQELDASRMGVFGISMGGIEGVFLTATDIRVKASVIALAGGDLPFQIIHTDEKRIRRARERFMAEEGLSLQELHRVLKEKIRLDPDLLAPYCDAGKTLMILAVFDRTILFDRGNALRKEMGNPETIYLLAGHRSAYLYIPYIKRASLNFFRRKLVDRLPPPSQGPL